MAIRFVALRPLAFWASVLLGGCGCSAAVETVSLPHAAPAPVEPQVAVSPQAKPAQPAAVTQPTQTPPPEPRPPAFVGKSVTVAQLLVALEQEALALEERSDVRVDYHAFLEQFSLPDGEQLFHDYVRVKLIFEATREGGLWDLRWDITNEQPNSEKIWARWAQHETASERGAAPSATAECDELSALFAYFAYRLGVRNLGLMWPTGNHVIAVWTIHREDKRPLRVNVPTSQVWLDDEDGLGTDSFNPYKQKTIYEYRRRDVSLEFELPTPFANFMIEQVRSVDSWAQEDLSQRRARNAARLEAAGS